MMPWLFEPSGTVFADTSGLFALAVHRDQRYEAAQELQRAFITTRTQLLTTNFVLAELHALMLSRVGAKETNELLFAVDRSRTLIVRANEGDEARAREIIRQYGDHGYSLTDATSFAVMDRLDLRRAFTFDDHFTRYGITIPVEV
jgi:predicted nucleic acid-binding protein